MLEIGHKTAWFAFLFVLLGYARQAARPVDKALRRIALMTLGACLAVALLTVALRLPADSELLREFHSESLELLQAIEQGVLRLEENPTDAGTIHSIFRAFHTFKGGAGLLHLGALRDLAHDLESLLDGARRSELTINSDVIDLILAGADTLKNTPSKTA